MLKKLSKTTLKSTAVSRIYLCLVLNFQMLSTRGRAALVLVCPGLSPPSPAVLCLCLSGPWIFPCHAAAPRRVLREVALKYK